MPTLEELSLSSKMKSSTEWFVDKFHEVKVGYDLNMSVTKWHEYLRDRRLIKVNYVYCIDILLAETYFWRNRKRGMNSDLI